MAQTSEGSFEPFMAIPQYLSDLPPIVDILETSTTKLQVRTINECLPLLNAINNPSSNPFDFDETGLPYLQRQAHVEFIHDGLDELPAQFVGMDASRPWLMYWSLLSLHIMGQNVEGFRSRIVDTFRPLQNASGGFGGGQGHLSHLAGTYAVLLSLAMVGGEEAYTLVDRSAMWHWLGRLKQPGGGFCVCEDGEEDVRGAYCALVAITLLDLPWQLPETSPARRSGLFDFRDKLGTYLSRCQTYEGGISASPSNEAHGAYAFCALACLCILGSPTTTIPAYLELDRLVKWLSARQYAPEGGLAGRTNKVVDGCYSHWIGGCWPLVEAAMQRPHAYPESTGAQTTPRLFDCEGLTRYILSCCQAPTGGLRDKPSKRPDAYHTCYNLAGLSMTIHQHDCVLGSTGDVSILQAWTTYSSEHLRAFAEGSESTLEGVKPFHPVYVIPQTAVHQMHEWCRAHTVLDGSMNGEAGHALHTR